MNTTAVNVKSLKVTADNGDVYEAVKNDGGPWDISYPEGGDRFHGSETELRVHINRLIKQGTSAKNAR